VLASVLLTTFDIGKSPSFCIERAGVNFKVFNSSVSSALLAKAPSFNHFIPKHLFL